MILQAGRFQLDLTTPKVMGILNVTPDSFSDGGRFNQLSSALKHVEFMIESGADIIDIGAESTRPGADLIDERTELNRLLPIIAAIQDRFDVCLSVDTNKPSVMREILALGVDLINDIKGFGGDESLLAVSQSKAAICIMHMQGIPKNMQKSPHYDDFFQEIYTYLEDQVKRAKMFGIAADRITIDPGFGFGKTFEQNIELVRSSHRLNEIAPVLLGISRKKTLGVILGDLDCSRIVASTTAALLSIQYGASIVRVHDVKETVDAIKVYQQIVG